MNKENIIAIARIKLPLATEAINKANLEAQSNSPDIDKLNELLYDSSLDGLMDVFELLSSYRSMTRLLIKHDPEMLAAAKAK